jgi:hypothetical protein
MTFPSEQHLYFTSFINKQGKVGPLPKEAMNTFVILNNELSSKPLMSFPRTDCHYGIITDVATGTTDSPGGLGAAKHNTTFHNFLCLRIAKRS